MLLLLLHIEDRFILGGWNKVLQGIAIFSFLYGRSSSRFGGGGPSPSPPTWLTYPCLVWPPTEITSDAQCLEWFTVPRLPAVGVHSRCPTGFGGLPGFLYPTFCNQECFDDMFSNKNTQTHTHTYTHTHTLSLSLCLTLTLSHSLTD